MAQVRLKEGGELPGTRVCICSVSVWGVLIERLRAPGILTVAHWGNVISLDVASLFLIILELTPQQIIVGIEYQATEHRISCIQTLQQAGERPYWDNYHASK
jgi:hypothetical protein